MSTSLNRAFTALRKARLSGFVSACFFLLACLLLLDGLQALMRSDFNQIDLPLGGQTLISGAMPQQAKNRADIVAIIEGLDGLDFVPLTDFRGHWFGAHMWRATLDASAATEAGRAVLTIVDMVPAKSTTGNATIMVQNPNQIYMITVWPSEEAMRAAHFSLSRRLTGLSAFWWVGASFACGAGVAVGHYFLHRAALRALAREGFFYIHGRKETEAGYLAIFSPSGRQDLQAQQPVSLLTPSGMEQQKGVLRECSSQKCSALFSLDNATAPRFGWLVRYEPDMNPVPAHEKDSSA
jgi:hypothetical protein